MARDDFKNLGFREKPAKGDDRGETGVKGELRW
jgi:hypothetical protein